MDHDPPQIWAAEIWVIAGLAIGGVILRPWLLPEAVWAVAGAALLILTGLLPVADAWRGIAAGGDVYLFLTGMMLLAEVARHEGLFDWMAALAAALAHGSATRLFMLVYLVGTIVTVFLSNDATAIVLTPAVAAIARAARAANPLPYLLICSFVANAASFVLPISNPANLVIYGSRMPPLLEWLPRYALPSLLSIAATYGMLWLTQRKLLRHPVARQDDRPALTSHGKVAAGGIVLTALVLMTASARGWQLGPPTCGAGIATLVAVSALRRALPWPVLRGISWGVLPLVAGLFVLVEALGRTHVLALLQTAVRDVTQRPAIGPWITGSVIAIACNLTNNLPAGLVAGSVLQAAQSPPRIVGSVLIGVDLGPNLSVTGSLATILWLTALRREGLTLTAGAFLKLGILIMPPALALALAALMLMPA